MSDTNNYRWTILGALAFAPWLLPLLFRTFHRFCGLESDVLHISYAEAGALMSLYTLPAIFLSLPGGMLVDRYGSKIVGGTSLLTMALGTVLVAVGDSYWVLGLGRLITGAGAAVLMVVAPRAITSWFYRREIGLSMGIFNIAVPIGVILSLNFTGLIAHLFHWRASVLTSLAVVVAALCLFLILYRNQNGSERVKADSPGLLSVLKGAGWGIWLVGLSWALFNAGILSFFTYAPDYFMAQGEDITKAGLLASYPMWGSIILAPVAGIFIDRIGQRRLLVSVGCAGMAILLYLIPVFPAHAGILAISMGVFMALLTPAIFSFPAELLPESVIGFGFGIINTALGVGIAVGPYVVGGLRDATGNYLWSFAAMAIFIALGIIPTLLLKSQISKTKRGNS